MAFPSRVITLLAMLLMSGSPSAFGESGFEWENISLGLSVTDLTSIAQVHGDSETLLVGGSGLVFRTDDDGDSWRMVLRVGSRANTTTDQQEDERSSREQDIEDLADELYRASHQRIEEDYGSDFADSIDSTLREEARESAEAEINRQRGGDRENGAMTLETKSADTRIRRIRSFADFPGGVFVCTEQGLFRSTDGGKSFKNLTFLTGKRYQLVEDVLPLSDGTILVATEGGIAVRAPDGSTYLSATPQNNKPARALAWHQESQRIIAGTDNGILASKDHGRSFQTLHVPMGAKSRHIRDLDAPEFAPSAIYAGTDDGALISLDGGDTFRSMRPARLGSSPIRRITHRMSPDRALFATHKGVYLSQNHGKSVREIYNGLSDRDVRDLVVAPKDQPYKMWAATRGGVFRYVKRHAVKLARKGWLRLGALTAQDPSLTKTLGVATEAAFMDTAVGDELNRRLRWRCLGPRLEIRHERSYQRDQTRTSPFDPFFPHVGRSTKVIPKDLETRVFLIFDLRDLIFQPLETTVAEYEERSTRRRRRFRERVVRLYHTRIELMLRLLATRQRGTIFVRRLQQYEALTATLDALTDHQLSWVAGNQLIQTPSEL